MSETSGILSKINVNSSSPPTPPWSARYFNGERKGERMSAVDDRRTGIPGRGPEGQSLEVGRHLVCSGVARLVGWSELRKGWWQ